MTISPRRYAGNDGVIAEDPQDIRRPSGNIVTAVGTPALPISVDISGVTSTATASPPRPASSSSTQQGALRRSRVTDIVTSEGPGAYDTPGGYRSDFLGYGVAFVTAADAAPAGARPRTLTLQQRARRRVQPRRRADRRRRPAAAPSSPSGLDLRGVISGSQIVGRSLCWDSNVDGNCHGTLNPPGNPDPKPLDTGPLFGQDGIRITAGARGDDLGLDRHAEPRPGRGPPVRNTHDEQRQPPARPPGSGSSAPTPPTRR